MQASTEAVRLPILNRSTIEEQLREKILFLEQKLRQLKERGIKENKICIPTSEGYEFINITHVIRCESDGNYTRIHLEGKPNLYVAKTLKQIEEALPKDRFFRVHKSHLINLDRIVKIFKNNGCSILLDSNDQVPISRNRKDSFFNLVFKS